MQAKNSNQETLESTDLLIRSGQIQKARYQINHINTATLSREEKLALAIQCRRVSLYTFGLKLLNPVVRPRGKRISDATDMEKAEYAALLTFFAANDEANRILKEVSPDNTPQVLLFRAFALFNQWAYDEAIPLLEIYIKSPLLTDYQKLIGQLNLCSALVHESDYVKTKAELDDLISKIDREKMQLILGNALELSAQNEARQKNFSRSLELLNQASELLCGSDGIESLYIQKCRALIGLWKSKGSEGLLPLRALRVKAKSLGYSEILRDCDRYEAIHLKSQGLAEKVFMGTPHSHFRKHLVHGNESWFTPPQKYIWQLGDKAATSQPMDILSLELPLTLYKTLKVLCSDFYRPLTIASLHAQVFQDEFYHPISTPVKIHRLIQRLRKELVAAKTPLLIKNENGSLSLHSETPWSIRVELPETSLKNPILDELKGVFQDKPFSAQEGAKVIQMSFRTVLRLVQQEVENQKMEQVGSGPKTKYRFSA